MRLPRVRFTVRRMMVAVGLLAVALHYVQAGQWWAVDQEVWQLRCNLSAEAHQIEETRYKGVAVGLSGGCRGLPVPPYCHKPDAGRAAHHARLKNEWRSAASRPWLLSRLGWPEPE